MVCVGLGGNVHSQNPNSGAAAPQASPTTAKCEIQDAKDCSISKGKGEFIRWKAPAGERRNVCFESPYPFATQEFHIKAGDHQDSGLIVIQPPPANGTKFLYHTGKNPCPNPDRHRNTAKVIIEE
jgi:hypothetical protein